MRPVGIATIRLAQVVALLIVSSCYSLPKVEVIRVIDDFAEDEGLTQPTWNVFGPWTCGLHVDQSQPSEGGQDAGQDGGAGGDVDAGQAVTCTLGTETDDMDPPIPPSTVTQALVASFDLMTPSSVEVVTRTKSGAPGASADAIVPSMMVNLTGFKQLLFTAQLGSTSSADLPAGTKLRVYLDCGSENLFTEFPLNMFGASWTPLSVRLDALLSVQNLSQNQTQICLATVDSIAFVVVPGAAPAGTKVSGTLLLDDIRLQ